MGTGPGGGMAESETRETDEVAQNFFTAGQGLTDTLVCVAFP